MGVSDAWRANQILMQKPNRKLLINFKPYNIIDIEHCIELFLSKIREMNFDQSATT